MKTTKKAVEAIQEEAVVEMTPMQRMRSDWKAVFSKFSYGSLLNNIPFIAFIALLGVVYISSNSAAVETQRAIEKQQTVLKELRWKYMDSKTRLMATGVEAEVIRRSAAIGLKPLMLPAYTIPKTAVDSIFLHPANTSEKP